MPSEIVQWGPCCFCGLDMAKTSVDPCRLTVETSSGLWQTWFCHSACFKERLSDRPELMGLMEPAHF